MDKVGIFFPTLFFLQVLKFISKNEYYILIFELNSYLLLKISKRKNIKRYKTTLYNIKLQKLQATFKK